MAMPHLDTLSVAEPFSNSSLLTYKNAPVGTPIHDITFITLLLR